MTILVPIALFGWIVVVLLLFRSLPSRRAAIVAFLGAWMFLPAGVEYKLPSLPAYDRGSATVIAVLLATAVFDPAKFRGLSLRRLDLPILVWCLCPFASSLSNGLGAYDGFSAVMRQTIVWGMPYLLGRMYLRRLEDVQELAYLTFLAGLVYVPLCLYEIRMSPNLSYDLYGLGGGSGIEYGELGKWGSRPSVFMGSALTVGLFMTAASVMGAWLWATGAVRQIRGYSTGWLLAILLGTTVMCKNLGALMLLAMGLTVLFSISRLRSRALIYLLLVAAPMWILLRSTGAWSAAPLVDAVSSIHADRADSLLTRLRNEDMLAAKALEQPAFGWGGWGRNRVYDEKGEDQSLTDGMWIIAMGSCGVTGLIAYLGTLLLPPLVLLRRIPKSCLTHPAVAGAVASAIFIILYSIDGLFNTVTANPVYLVCVGGVVNAASAAAVLTRRTAPARGRPAVQVRYPGGRPLHPGAKRVWRGS